MGGSKTYAVDFDGTLCESCYPQIGKAKDKIIDYLKSVKLQGDKIILWTCRCDEKLDEAVEWCKNQELEFDAVNENLPENIELFGSDCRKIYADYYIDDKALTLIDIENIISKSEEVRKIMDKRHAYFKSELKTRADSENGDRYIEGYFAVFNQETQLWPGCYEKIAPGAFDNSIKNNDIRCLFNHDSGFVLGRTANQTLELRVDAHGLWGRVKINPNDRQAMDAYARVDRGDISGCSFGFNPINESYEEKADGYHYTVSEADTAEVSICTFPAYPQTEIQARQKDFEQSKSRKLEQRKSELKKKLEAIRC